MTRRASQERKKKDENNVASHGKRGLSLNVLGASPVGLMQCVSASAFTPLCAGVHGVHIGPMTSKAGALP